MASTQYTDYTTPAVNAAWLNDVNDNIYDTPFVPPAAGTFRNTLIGPTGGNNVGVRKNYTTAVAQLLSTQVSNMIFVSDFLDDPDTELPAIQGGILKPDIKYAIDRAVAAFPRQGAPVWQQWTLVFPMGVATVSGTVFILNQQGGALHAHGCQIEGNFAGPIIQIGDSSGVNDCLRFHVYGGTFANFSTAAGACGVRGIHLYACTLNQVYFYGGEYALRLDGNSNVINGCAMRGATLAGVKTGEQANNEANQFVGCAVELNTGYGYDLSVVAGVGGFTVIQGGYIENNTLGNILCTNSMKALVEGVYFNLQNNKSALILGGTVGANYQDPQVEIRNCRVLGSTTGTPKFIEELSSSSINAIYAGNSLETDTCDMYGSAPKSINARRRGDKVYIKNIGFTGGPPPTNWTVTGPGPVVSAAPVSPYGSPGSVQISGVTQIAQLLLFPANALLRVSCQASTTGNNATMQMLNAAGTVQFPGAIATNTTSTTQRLEFYVPADARASATSGTLIFINATGVNNAYFDDPIIEDMTN